MKKGFSKLLLTATLCSGLILTACGEDKEPIKNEYSQIAIDNSQVQAKLKAQGITLDATGKVFIDEKARTLTSLDLSETAVKDFAFLALFPKLTEVKLAKNGYKLSFDFAQLPKNITSVDLSDNELYEFKGLAHIEEKTKATVIDRELKSLTLPHSAKYNIEVLPFYFKKLGHKLAMSMQNKEGKAEAYTTLREIPDTDLRALLKQLYPSKFEGDKLDLFKRFGESRSEALDISYFDLMGQGVPLFEKDLKSLEGIEYILGDPEFSGRFQAVMKSKYTLAYVKLSPHCSDIKLVNISTPYLDLSNSKSLQTFFTETNEDIKVIDLSNSEKIGQIGILGADAFLGSLIVAGCCPNLESISLPKKLKKDASLYGFALYGCPKLKGTIDLSQFEHISLMRFLVVPKIERILYPQQNFLIDDKGKILPNQKQETDYPYTISLELDKEAYGKPSIQDFFNRMQGKFPFAQYEEGDKYYGQFSEFIKVSNNGKDYFEIYPFKVPTHKQY